MNQQQLAERQKNVREAMFEARRIVDTLTPGQTEELGRAFLLTWQQGWSSGIDSQPALPVTVTRGAVKPDNGMALAAILALEECEDYFDQRSDADGDSEGYHPNREMTMLVLVQDALAKIRKAVQS